MKDAKLPGSLWRNRRSQLEQHAVPWVAPQGLPGSQAAVGGHAVQGARFGEGQAVWNVSLLGGSVYAREAEEHRLLPRAVLVGERENRAVSGVASLGRHPINRSVRTQDYRCRIGPVAGFGEGVEDRLGLGGGDGEHRPVVPAAVARSCAKCRSV